MDLFDLGTGSQVHDFNGGVLPSGLFWTIGLGPGAFFQTSNDRRARLHARDVPLTNSFQFAGANVVPATVSFTVEWEATGPAEALGSGASVPATDAAAFLGTFAPARATGRFSGCQLGFSFESKTGVSSDAGYAEIGRERNGAML